MDTTNDVGRKLKVAGVVLLSLLSVFVLIKIISELKGLPYVGRGDSYMGTISVNGKGEVVAIPDVATFTFSVSEESPVVATAQTRATEKMNSILAFLRDSGVAEEDIKTTDYSIYPRYNYERATGRQTLAAYIVTQSVEVKVEDTANAGALLSGVGEFGATNISGLNFSVDNYDELVKEARDKAIAEAKENAEKLARELGVDLVRVTSYYDQGNYPPIYYSRDVAMEGFGGANMAVPTVPELPAGENKIISNVSITYEIR